MGHSLGWVIFTLMAADSHLYQDRSIILDRSLQYTLGLVVHIHNLWFETIEIIFILQRARTPELWRSWPYGLWASVVFQSSFFLPTMPFDDREKSAMQNSRKVHSWILHLVHCVVVWLVVQLTDWSLTNQSLFIYSDSIGCGEDTTSVSDETYG